MVADQPITFSWIKILGAISRPVRISGKRARRRLKTMMQNAAKASQTLNLENLYSYLRFASRGDGFMDCQGLGEELFRFAIRQVIDFAALRMAFSRTPWAARGR